MEWLNDLAAVTAGMIVRLGVPITLTALLVALLRRLDEHWRAEAGGAQVVTAAKNPGCWDVKNCSAEQRANCKAHAHPETPCWQLFRARDGRLQERCVGCDVFRKAPVPVQA